MLLKLIKFIVNSHIFLALAAAGITLATQVQLGFRPQIDAFVAMIFLATVFDYNLHRFLTLKSIPESIQIKKNSWAAGNLSVLKAVIIISFILLVSSLFFLRVNMLYMIVPLAMLTLLYSVSYLKNRWNGCWHKRIPGVKTVLLAFIWAASTAFLVSLSRENTINTSGFILISIERFAFIFAIAIPFDIRDMEADRKSGINTIPIAFGPDRAIQISNISLVIALLIAISQYSEISSVYTLAAFILSIGITLILINSKKLRTLPCYHNGILDGCVFLHGILVVGSYFIQT
jgi:4-hydroxybenzoate polyprenyltransferase